LLSVFSGINTASFLEVLIIIIFLLIFLTASILLEVTIILSLPEILFRILSQILFFTISLFSSKIFQLNISSISSVLYFSSIIKLSVEILSKNLSKSISSFVFEKLKLYSQILHF